ncbi:amidohydrolase [Kitasatospora sp. MAP5-34]|uniref:amidohydrolase n=1 Tax=Kitasatospora sp. MAP5-34 TaxID=3035102 RepID=UPI002473AA07|nr:amidohydrolase [Kitasatospora sp. MAP5-34]MDH6574658.1 putative amidohydrolase YtcJ [Kitasatospora sp. MAP5-34]
MITKTDEPAADLVLYNGKVLTLDGRSTVAEGIAVRDGLIQAVGSGREVLSLAGPATRRVDLRGHTVIPGLIDAHFRLMDRSTAQLYGADVSLADSVESMLGAVRHAAKRIPPGAIITSNAGWYPQMLTEGREPTRAELDEAAPDHPVVLRGEHLYLNSAALRRFGIDARTPQPEYGWIERDPQTGEPTGILAGDAALLLGGAHLDFTRQQRTDAVRWALGECARAGVTTVREGGIRLSDLGVYQELRDAGELPIRVAAQLALDIGAPTEKIMAELGRLPGPNPVGDSWLRIDHAGYLFADDDYHRMMLTGPVHSGRVPADRARRYFRDRCASWERIESVVRAMAEQGFSGGILAGGDAALDGVLDLLERVNADTPLADRRWVVSQAVYPKARHLPRLRALGVVLTPMWHHLYYYPALVAYHGREFAQTMDPFRTLLDSGLRVGLGSDVSRVPLNYFAAIAFLHTRQTWKWGPVNAGEALSREQALRMLTINNAYVTFEEDRKGSLEPGKLADLVVLSDDLMTVPAELIAGIRALVTMVGGQLVHQEPSFVLSP